MNAHSKTLFALPLLAVLLGSCKQQIDSPHQGLFIIANQSGHDVTLTVFKTTDRRQAPITVAVANGGSVERRASGDFGGFAYPELFFQGDSVMLAFSDGKRLLHYCTQAQQLQHTCAPAHNVLDIYQYQTEALSANNTQYTFTLMPGDYNNAQ